MCHSHHSHSVGTTTSHSESHSETIDTREIPIFGSRGGVSSGTTHSTTYGHGGSATVNVGAGHDDDLVEREARSLAAQISRLADVLTVREFAALRLKIDGTFDHLLFDDGSS